MKLIAAVLVVLLIATLIWRRKQHELRRKRHEERRLRHVAEEQAWDQAVGNSPQSPDGGAADKTSQDSR